MPTHPILGQPTRALPHDHVACDSFWCARCMLHAIARAALPLLCCLSYRALKVLTRCRQVPIILMPTPHTILWLEEDPICACEYLCVWACVCICVRVCVRVRVCVCPRTHGMPLFPSHQTRQKHSGCFAFAFLVQHGYRHVSQPFRAGHCGSFSGHQRSAADALWGGAAQAQHNF